MSGINLSKGGRIDLSKVVGLNRVRAELKWTTNATDTGSDFDLDLSIFVCHYDTAGDPKLIDDGHFVFYNMLALPNGSVVKSPDNTTGGGDGEDAVVDFTKLDAAVDEIAFVVTIHDAEARRQNFGQVSKASITLFNDETNDIIGGYKLEDDFSNETAVQFGSVYKKSSGDWTFKAVGAGYAMGLAEFVIGYGGNVKG
jgi:tellurium resistance protein TerD